MMRINDLITWDTLNKGAILVTLLTALFAFLSYILSQALLVIILISTSSIALLLVFFRSFWFRHEIELKNTTLTEVFGISKDLINVVFETKKQTKQIRGESGGNRRNIAKVLLKKNINSLAKIATDYAGNNCVVACSILEDAGIEEGKDILLRTITQSDNIVHKINENIELPLSESVFTQIFEKSLKPIIIKDLNKKDFKYYTTSSEISFQSAAIAPILDVDGKLLGFLSLNSLNNSSFDKDILVVLEFYSGWCSIILLEILDEIWAEQQL